MMKEVIRSSRDILIPKGENNQVCIDAFQQYADIEIPEFKDEELFAQSAGRNFWRVKARDIPNLVRMDPCPADVGVVGSDVMLNADEVNQQCVDTTMLREYAMGRFSLLANWCDVTEMRERLNSRFETTKTLTSYPRLLGRIAAARDLPVVPQAFEVNGSIERVMDLLDMRLAADIVVSGETATQNNKVELLPLIDINPTIIAKKVQLW